MPVNQGPASAPVDTLPAAAPWPALKRVLVLGGGLPALALALGAARAGAAVDLAPADDPEADDPPRPLHVPPNMVRDLLALDVAPACIAAGFPYCTLGLADTTARVLCAEEMPRLAGATHPSALGICRASLAQVLGDAAAALGVRRHAGRARLRMKAPGGRMQATFDDGRGRFYGLVVASGPGTASGQTGPAPWSEFIGLQAWTVLVRRPPMLDQVVTVPCPPGGRAVLVPVSHAQAGVTVSVLADHAAPAPVAGRAAVLRGHLRGFSGPLALLREQIVDDQAVHVSALYSGLKPSPWYHGGVLSCGHAAHAVAPHLGQAEAQAFEDAVVLCDLLRHCTSAQELAQRLEQRRSARCRDAVALARQAAQGQLHPTPQTDLGRLAATQAACVATPP